MLSKERRIFLFSLVIASLLSIVTLNLVFREEPLVIGSLASASVIDQEATKVVFYGTPLSTADIVLVMNIVGVMFGVVYVLSLSLIGKR